MTRVPSPPSREEVLDAFAVEPDTGRATLERYLREYPEYAAELADLSRELSRDLCEDEGPLSTKDREMIDAAWRQHLAAAPKMVNPLAALSTAELRQVAVHLDVPRQVIAAFRERRVIVTSVPRRFLARFAASVNSTIDLLISTVAPQPMPHLVRSYKSETRPAASAPVTFEQLLIDAGVPDEKRMLLMADDD